MPHISITYIQINRFWHLPRFYYYSNACFKQAENSEGVIDVKSKVFAPLIYSTLTMWEDKSFMKKYVASGAHLKAMKEFHNYSNSYVYGYESDQFPQWEEILSLVKGKGRLAGPYARN